MRRALSVGIVHPADPAGGGADRFGPVCEAFRSRGVQAEAVGWRDEVADEVRRRLRGLDAALVWVNPIHDGRDRSVLDAVLREAAKGGVFVSTHPDVILKMGTKEVLHRTRGMGWASGDIHLYRTAAEMREALPSRLAGGTARVLKQNRGNGGNGVWRVSSADAGGTAGAPDPAVCVLHALRGSREEEMPLSRFVARCAPYFEGEGRVIDQPFFPPGPDGMVRCYMTHGEVVGFGHQHVTALMGPEPPAPPPRLYHPPSEARFQAVRARMEERWIPEMQRVLDVATEALPVLWDADFLCGERGAGGEETFVLCEINVSSVHPFPESALPRFVEATLRRISG